MGTLNIADIPDDLDDRLLFCDSGPAQERVAEHQRLRSAVVEAVKASRGAGVSRSCKCELCKSYNGAVDALIQFESEHGIGEK